MRNKITFGYVGNSTSFAQAIFFSRQQIYIYIDIYNSSGYKMKTVTLYRPTGPDEIELARDSGFRRWPPRLSEQPIFYPVTNEEYAREIAVKWNIKESGVGYVTRFEVRQEFMDRYDIRQVGAADHTEWWIPAGDLEELNDNIVGLIEVIGEYK
jgi:hypothetical protein